MLAIGHGLLASAAREQTGVKAWQWMIHMKMRRNVVGFWVQSTHRPLRSYVMLNWLCVHFVLAAPFQVQPTNFHAPAEPKVFFCVCFVWRVELDRTCESLPLGWLFFKCKEVLGRFFLIIVMVFIIAVDCGLLRYAHQCLNGYSMLSDQNNLGV